MATPRPPILYLDFDGVLHPDEAYQDRKGRVYLQGPGRLFMWAKQLEEALSPHPHVRVVLSTSWVRVKSFSYARDRLPAGLRARVVGATWHSDFRRHHDMRMWWDYATRCEQIQADVLRRQPPAWVAVDDDHKQWDPRLRHHLVATSGAVGLGSAEAQSRLSEALSALSQGNLVSTPFRQERWPFPSL